MPGAYYERNLPHWQPEGKTLFLTWRLSGSLPVTVMSALRGSRTQELGKRFREFDQVLDRAEYGPMFLRDRRVAEVVVEAIEKVVNGGLCRVHAWVVMPNHVHVLLEPRVGLAAITKSLKGSTARKANLILGRTEKYFWQDESFDHWVRNEAEFGKIKKYIEGNPVSAGLVSRAQDWKWSSASEAGV